MLLLGCRPPGRFTEQHDVFFGIAEQVKDLIPAIKESWKETKGNIHVDAWREVNSVDGFSIKIVAKDDRNEKNKRSLFFINLGGYRENEFDEFHYKLLVVASHLEEAKAKAKRTAFFKYNNVAAAVNNLKAFAHIDDKYGIDTDDAFAVVDILPLHAQKQFHVVVSNERISTPEDPIHLGFFKLSNL